MTLAKYLSVAVAALVLLLLHAIDPALAQEAAAEAAPAAPAAPAIDTGDTAWMLTSTAIVLMMTVPGLALFYGGMVRKKNVLSVMMQCFAAICIVTILWMVIGYSLAFTDGGSLQTYIGGMERFMLGGMTLDSTHALAGTIPESVFMTFQMTFAIITPALVVGAFVDRMKFSAYVLFIILWLLVVYVPVAHWVWGGGFIGAAGVLDFAGGTVVHINAGIAGLVAALYLGRRYGYGSENMAPNNLVYSVVGAGLLWVGWFGFNAGSAAAAGGRAGMAMAATQIATAAAALAWMFAEWIVHKKPSVLGIISGAIAGLVAITPAAGFVAPSGALWIGLIAGVGCFFASTTVKKALGYDDSLDVFGIHGVGGIIGAVLTGVFATAAIGGEAATGALEGNVGQIMTQLYGVGVTVIWAGVMTLVILVVINMLVGVRVSQSAEVEGLDINLHGEVVP
jgi:Amt family ammonium transporter